MRKTKISDVPISDRLLVTIPEFANYCGSGRFTADKIATMSGAVIFIGSRKFVNMSIAKRYLDALAENQ